MSFEPSRYLNQTILAVPKSGIRKFFDVAATMPGAISLGVGEPDFVTPYHIRNAAINSLLDGETAYTSNWGLLSLREEIARYMQDRYHLTYDPGKEILVTVGASEGIDLSLRVLMNPGDEVLIPEPSYVSYAPGVVFAGGVPVPVPTSEQNGFRADARSAGRRRDTPHQGRDFALSQQPHRRGAGPPAAGAPARRVCGKRPDRDQRRDLFRADLHRGRPYQHRQPARHARAYHRAQRL